MSNLREAFKDLIVENAAEVIGIIAEEDQFDMKFITQEYAEDRDLNDVRDELLEALAWINEKLEV